MKKPLLFAILLLLSAVHLPLISAQKAEVSLYVLNLGKFDAATGEFTADFYLHFKCQSPCGQQAFEFVNGRATDIDVIEDTPASKFYRIQANLHSPIDLKQFPFDTQHLTIILEDTNSTIEALRYIPREQESGIDSSILFPGWNIAGWSAAAREHYYGVYNETYSQYQFTVDASRIGFSSFMKTFLPVLFIALVVLLSFILDPDKITERLAMAGSGLIASVMFHISISNQIPPVSYLTFADKFMVLTYFIILITFAINIVLLELKERNKRQLVNRLHRYTEYNMLVFGLVLYILLFVFFM